MAVKGNVNLAYK